MFTLENELIFLGKLHNRFFPLPRHTDTQVTHEHNTSGIELDFQ